MSEIDWCKKLGWTEDQLEDLRYTGYAYLRQGKYDIAISFYEALVILDQKNSYDAQTLGALYLQVKEPMKAIKWLDHALKMEEKHGPTLLNLCKAFLMLGKKEEALKVATILKDDSDFSVANTATALLMAYS